MAKREGTSKFDALQKLLSSPEGLRLRADVEYIRKCYDEAADLREAATELEGVRKARDAIR
jgi:hypothetical protein